MFQETIDQMAVAGFHEEQTNSGTGSRILFNRPAGRVVKLNQEHAYNRFTEFAISNPTLRVPRVHRTEKVGVAPYDGLSGFTLVEIDLLSTIEGEDYIAFKAWLDGYEAALKSQTMLPDDMYGVLDTLELLRQFAIDNGVGLDLKPENFMRTQDDVIIATDPLGPL